MGVTGVDVTILQGALRLLFLLDRGGIDFGDGCPVEGAVRVVRSEKRLQALDFWMRNPDYLAAEMLAMIGNGGLERSDADLVRGLLEDGEPDLRRYPMIRWHFGAYEPIDDAFSKLVTAGLAVCRRSGDPTGRRRSNFYLLAKGAETADTLVEEEPSLTWYRDRAVLVARVAGNDSGNALKQRQYAHVEYAQTEIGSRFAAITDVVRQRLSDLGLAS